MDELEMNKEDRLAHEEDLSVKKAE